MGVGPPDFAPVTWMLAAPLDTPVVRPVVASTEITAALLEVPFHIQSNPPKGAAGHPPRNRRGFAPP